MTTYHAPDEYTGMVLYVKNPTMDRMIDAVWALPEDLRLEYWFRYEPRPKSKRIYLTEKEEFREAMQNWGIAGASAGTMFCKKYDFMFGGFLPRRFQGPEVSFSYDFSIHHDLDKKVEEGRQYALRAFEHFARFFDTYYGVASPIRALEAQQDARKEVFSRKPPFERYDPDSHTNMPSSYAHAKFRFPFLGWITYLSDELIADYALDLDELRALAWKFEDLGETASARRLYRIQFWEHRDDWQEKTPALIDICLRADRYNYREEEWYEEIVFKKRYTVEKWHEWLLPDCWWEK